MPTSLDDIAEATAKTTWTKDTTVTYNFLSQGVLSFVDFLKENIAGYPNPERSFVEVSLSNGLQLKSIEIYNKIGKKITATKSAILNVENLSAGIY